MSEQSTTFPSDPHETPVLYLSEPPVPNLSEEMIWEWFEDREKNLFERVPQLRKVDKYGDETGKLKWVPPPNLPSVTKKTDKWAKKVLIDQWALIPVVSQAYAKWLKFFDRGKKINQINIAENASSHASENLFDIERIEILQKESTKDQEEISFFLSVAKSRLLQQASTNYYRYENAEIRGGKEHIVRSGVIEKDGSQPFSEKTPSREPTPIERLIAEEESQRMVDEFVENFLKLSERDRYIFIFKYFFKTSVHFFQWNNEKIAEKLTKKLSLKNCSAGTVGHRYPEIKKILAPEGCLLKEDKKNDKDD